MDLQDSTTLFIISIGDWSGDGHGKCENVIFRTNKSIKEMRQAYTASCAQFGIRFHANPHVAGDAGICTEYGHSTLTPQQVEKLQTAGCPFNECIADFDPKDSDDTPLNAEDLAELIMWFISKNLPGLSYSRVQLPVLNGCWAEGFNHEFGYGVFD